MGSAPFVSPLAEELASDVLERLLRYVRIDTQSQAEATTYPSTAKQLDLSRLLVGELEAIGVEDVLLDEHGYVTATLPGAPGSPVIGLVAHVDTSPDAPGAGVSPIVHEDYDGGRIVLPGDPTQVLDPEEMPALAQRVGHDIVTSDGTTLLGADDKAGVAVIMAAVAYLHGRSEPHTTIRIAFTVDEEIGRGVQHFDVDAFGADAAYTLDGSGLAELQIETFSARQLKVRFGGRSEHTGTAKGKLVNAVKLAAAFVASLPPDTLSPETTEQREGFVHPTRISGGVEETTVTLIVRDHDEARLDQHEELVRRLATEAAAADPRARVEITGETQYENMRYEIEKHPQVVAVAEEAYRRAGLEPVRTIIRGGTDGARLTAKGLPTPNVFTGGQSYHSRREWASVQDMGAAASVVVEIARIWAGRTVSETG